MADNILLKVQGLKVAYGGIQAVKGVDFEVRQGELVSLIGANGAGKTTTLKAVTGLQNIAMGEVQFMGRSIQGQGAWDLVRQGLVMVPEGRGTFTRMTITENLLMGAYIRDDAEIEADIDKVFGLFPRLKERRNQLAGTMSGGEQQMLAMGRALMARPKVLLLDEPSMGLSPIMVDKIFEVVRDVYALGVTIVLVEQNVHFAAELADRHGLDQAQDEAPRDAVFGHRLDLLVRGVGQRDHVDLDLPEAEPAGRLQPVEDLRQHVAPGDLRHAAAVKRIQAHVEPRHAGTPQVAGKLGQPGAVGGQGQIADARHRGQAGGELRQIAAQQRFAAGQPDALDALAGKDTGEPLELVEAQPLAGFVVALETFGHAVGAAQVAAVGDGQPQIADVSAQAVDEHRVLVWSKGPGRRASGRSGKAAGVQKLFETANTTRWSKIFRPAGEPYTLWVEPMSVSW